MADAQITVLGAASLVGISFCWSWLTLRLAASTVGAEHGTWRNCAILTGIGYGVCALIVGGGVLAYVSPVPIFGWLWGGISALGILFLARITMNMLDIGFGKLVSLWLVMWGFDAFGAFVFQKIIALFSR